MKPIILVAMLLVTVTSANARSILGFKCDEEIVGLGSNKDTAPYVYNFYFVVTGATQNIDFKWRAGGTAYMNGKPCEKNSIRYHVRSHPYQSSRRNQEKAPSQK